MKKILFFIHDMMHGGAEKVLVNLVNNMDKTKYDITVMTIFDVGVNKQFLGEDIHYKYVFKNMFRGNNVIFRMFKPETLYKYMIKDKYDIIVSYLEGSCTRIISGCPDEDVKKFAWVHIAQDETEFKKAYKSKDEAIQCYRKFDKIACVSMDVKENFINLSNIKNNVEVIYNTNETDEIIKQSKEDVDDVIFDENIINICGVAKVRPRKGFMRLARVHKKLMEEGYKYHIYVLGEGEEKEKIKKYLNENSLSNSFTFLGYRVNPYKYVEKCDLFICPSFEEGFSTAVTESLLVGTPVVTTLCSGMKELLGKNNEYGIIEENSEEGIYRGLKKVLENPQLIKYYNKQIIERAKKFSKEETIISVQNFFEVEYKR